MIQLSFVVLCVWIGVEFFLFINYLESGGVGVPASRPPGVEGFLPISSLMSLYYLFLSGQIHPAHPAGLFIFVAIIVISLIFGKSFCSWLCPAGFLSEMLGNLGEKIFRQKLTLPRTLDYLLRSVKYLLLGFFSWAIFVAMDTPALRVFLDSTYNRVADLKMWYFFADFSQTTAIVIGSLLVLSVIVRNFWCRYLCPYGALLGIASLLSPAKIKRDRNSCLDCGECAQACPSRIKVDQVGTVVSDECSSCLACVDSCPAPNSLSLRLLPTGHRLPQKIVAVIIVFGFVLITGLGLVTGNWSGDITHEEYRRYLPNIHSYGHPTGATEIEQLNRRAKPTTNLEAADQTKRGK